MDYRSNSGNIKNYISDKKSETVIASTPNIKKIDLTDKTAEKRKLETPKTRVNSLEDEDICIKVHSPRKNLFYKVMYAVLILVLGAVGVLIFLSLLSKENPTADVMTQSYIQYYQLLSPVVMNDPAPFDKPENANIQLVISSCIWHAITKNGTQKYNTFDERGFSLIPVSDVIEASKELFGPDYVLNTNESMFGSFYSLYAGDKNFHVAAISNQNSCIPYIKDITETDEFVTLNVGYVTRDDKFLREDDEKAPEPNPIKYMKYNFKKNKNNNSIYIYSVENP